MFKTRQSFAINISDASIEALELVREGSELKARSYNRVLLVSGIIEDGKIIDPEKLKVAVRTLLNEAKPEAISTKEVIISFPESKVFTQSFFLPKSLHRKQVPAALISRAKEALPIDPVVMAADFIETGEMEDSVEYLFAATYQEIVQEYVEFFQKLGLKVSLVTMESLAL